MTGPRSAALLLLERYTVKRTTSVTRINRSGIIFFLMKHNNINAGMFRGRVRFQPELSQ